MILGLLFIYLSSIKHMDSESYFFDIQIFIVAYYSSNNKLHKSNPFHLIECERVSSSLNQPSLEQFCQHGRT